MCIIIISFFFYILIKFKLKFNVLGFFLFYKEMGNIDVLIVVF